MSSMIDGSSLLLTLNLASSYIEFMKFLYRDFNLLRVEMIWNSVFLLDEFFESFLRGMSVIFLITVK